MKKLAAVALSALALLALGAPAYAGKPAKKDCGARQQLRRLLRLAWTVTEWSRHSGSF